MSAAVLNPGLKAKETVLLPAWICLEILLYILDRVMRVRLNLPTALVLHFELSAVVLVATSCCSMC